MKNVLKKLLLVAALPLFLVSCDAEDDAKYEAPRQDEISSNFIDYDGTKYALQAGTLLYQGASIISNDPLEVRTVWVWIMADYQPPYTPGAWSDFLNGAPTANFYYAFIYNIQNQLDSLEYPGENGTPVTYDVVSQQATIAGNPLTMFNEEDEALFSDATLTINSVDYDNLEINTEFAFTLDGKYVSGNFDGGFEFP